jgi:hypothetical protein
MPPKLTKADVLAVIARELAPAAKAFAAGDYDRGDALIEPYVTDTLCERQSGKWAAFENLIFDVQAKLDPFEVGANDDRAKFARHVVKYVAKPAKQANAKQGTKPTKPTKAKKKPKQ